MTATTSRNEAAERLIDVEMAERFGLAMGEAASVSEDDFTAMVDAALAAERRETVERIRHPILNAIGHSKVGADRVRAILDEEAARG